MKNIELSFTNQGIQKALVFLLSATLAFFAFSGLGLIKAGAETETSDANHDSAIKELSAATGQTITNKEEAKKICNQEANIATCAEIGKKYSLYKAEQIKEVDAVLEEIKGNVSDELKNCRDEECFMNVADKLAKKMVSRRPEIASKFELTQSKIKEKRAVVEKAKELGVSFQQCKEADPDTASVETLRACAKLSRDESMKQYIPEAALARADQLDSTIELKESLASGKYQCGDGTPEGCGNFCLNPTAEARAGASAIPQVCRQIAEEFFGPDGVKHLESAYSQVGQVQDFYKKRAENVVFVTPEGTRLTDPSQIGRYIESQGKAGNIGAVEKGMDFMVANGFVKQEEKEFAVKMLREFSAKGAPVDFDKCRENPESCEEFVPQEFKGEFQAMRETEKIFKEAMAKEGVPDPRLCSDPAYSEKCLAASKNALPRLESVQGNVPNFASEMKKNIEFSEQGFQARKKAEEQFKQSGGKINVGNQEFSNFEEMSRFCETNGSSCLTEATKQGFVNADFAVQKFEQAFEQSQQFSPPPFTGGPSGFQFPGQGQTGGQFPGQGQGIQGGFPGQGFGPPTGGTQQFGNQSGGGFPGSFNKEDAIKQFKTWAENPESAPPPTQFNFPGTNFQSQGGHGQEGQFRQRSFGGQPSNQSQGERTGGEFQNQQGDQQEQGGFKFPFSGRQGEQGNTQKQGESGAAEQGKFQFPGQEQGTEGQFPGRGEGVQGGFPGQGQGLMKQGEPRTGEFKQGEGQYQKQGEFPGKTQQQGQPFGNQEQGKTGNFQFPGRGETKGQFPGQNPQGQFPGQGQGTQFKPGEFKPGTEGQLKTGEGQFQQQQQQQQIPSTGDRQFQQPFGDQFKPQEGQQNQQFQQQPSGSGSQQQPTGGFQQPSTGDFKQPEGGFQQPSGGFQQPSGGTQFPSGGGTFTPGSVFGIFQKFFSNIGKIFSR